MSSEQLKGARAIVGQIVLYGLFIVFIGVFSRWPSYQVLAPDLALIKLSFSHHGKPVSDCREASAAELAKLPPNMRAPVRCPRERSPVTVELDVDDAAVYRHVARPSGLSRDGAASVYHRIEAGDWTGVDQVCSDVEYLTARVMDAGTQALENDFAMASARCPDPVRQKEWRDLQRAVREETHWLRRDPAALPSLLYNRLRCFGWPGARISRALSMPQGVPQLTEGEYLGRANEMIDGVLAELWRTLGRKTDE